MDPVTAAFNAFGAFNQFLITPAGQKLATDAEQLIQDFMGLFKGHISNMTTPKA